MLSASSVQPTKEDLFGLSVSGLIAPLLCSCRGASWCGLPFWGICVQPWAADVVFLFDAPHFQLGLVSVFGVKWLFSMSHLGGWLLLLWQNFPSFVFWGGPFWSGSFRGLSLPFGPLGCFLPRSLRGVPLVPWAWDVCWGYSWLPSTRLASLLYSDTVGVDISWRVVCISLLGLGVMGGHAVPFSVCLTVFLGFFTPLESVCLFLFCCLSPGRCIPFVA